MPNRSNRNERVTVHHPQLGVEQTVRRRQAEVMAASGWKHGPAPQTPPAPTSTGTPRGGQTQES